MWKIGDQPKYAFFIRRGCFEFFECPESVILFFNIIEI